MYNCYPYIRRRFLGSSICISNTDVHNIHITYLLYSSSTVSEPWQPIIRKEVPIWASFSPVDFTTRWKTTQFAGTRFGEGYITNDTFVSAFSVHPSNACGGNSLLVPPIQVIIIRLSRNHRKYISFIITIIIMYDLLLITQVKVRLRWETVKKKANRIRMRNSFFLFERKQHAKVTHTQARD